MTTRGVTLSDREQENKLLVVVTVGPRATALAPPPTWSRTVDWFPASELEPALCRAVVVCVFDGQDEAHLGIVRTTLEQFRRHPEPVAIVAYRPRSSAGHTREHLARLAAAWNAVVLIPGSPDVGLGDVVSACLECLAIPGLLCVHDEPYEKLLRPPGYGEVHVLTCDERHTGSIDCPMPVSVPRVIGTGLNHDVLATLWLPDGVGLKLVNDAYSAFTDALPSDAELLLACNLTSEPHIKMSVVKLFPVHRPMSG